MSATKTGTLHPIPYLGFDGNCAEAMRYYEKVLGGKITVMMSGADSPIADQMAKELGIESSMLNSNFRVGGGFSLAIRRRMSRTRVSKESISH